MKSVEFCYWLQGYFELTGVNSPLGSGQVDLIRKHLSMVFKHEIDPSYPGSVELTAIHSKPIFPDLSNTTMRC